MKVMEVISAILTAVGIGLAVFGLFTLVTAEPIAYYNEGKIIFETEDEYSEFKREIARSSIEIDSVTVLHLSPPIVVDFRILVPVDEEFPYGQNTENFERDPAALTLGLVSLAIGLAAILVSAAINFASDW